MGPKQDYAALTRNAVAHYWMKLKEQEDRQQHGTDHGRRAAVTGGKQMDKFCELISAVCRDNGIPTADIYTERKLELPGYFRPTKKWDMLVTARGRLVAAIEFKSQRGPSFGNNMNNRSEEAIGTAVDLWTAYREGAFGPASPRPFVGWVMLLEDCAESRARVGVAEPHFKVFREFAGTSYAERYELLLRRLRLEKLFDSTCLLLSTEKDGPAGIYSEPASDLAMNPFLAGLAGHIVTFSLTT